MGDGERFEDAVEHQNGSTSRNQRSEEKQKYKKPTFDVKDLVNAGSSTTAPVGGSRGSSANGHSDEPLDNHDSGSEDKEAGAQTDKSRPSVRDWFNIGNRDFNAKGLVSKSDGRLHLSVNETANRGYFAKALGASLHSHLGSSKQDVKPPQQKQRDEEVESIVSRTAAETAERPIPRLNIVVMVVGSRGDIQPFIRVSKILRDEYGHRVRVATHPAFKDFVEKDCGLEFFSIGGDPAELMAFMVKNPGLVPSFDTIRKGEIGRRRQQMSEMFAGFWRSCIEESDGETHNEGFEPRPFVADAIISNPPVMIHIHCAERLGCPLHIMFTFPYT